MKILIPRCPHPKCGVLMQRLYKRDNGRFVPAGWLCPDCGQIVRDSKITQWYA